MNAILRRSVYRLYNIEHLQVWQRDQIEPSSICMTLPQHAQTIREDRKFSNILVEPQPW